MRKTIFYYITIYKNKLLITWDDRNKAKVDDDGPDYKI